MVKTGLTDFPPHAKYLNIFTCFIKNVHWFWPKTRPALQISEEKCCLGPTVKVFKMKGTGLCWNFSKPKQKV